MKKFYRYAKFYIEKVAKHDSVPYPESAPIHLNIVISRETLDFAFSLATPNARVDGSINRANIQQIHRKK